MARSGGYPTDFFRPNEIIHRISGLWVFDTEPVSKRRKTLQDLYSFSVYSVTTFFIVMEFVIFKDTVKEIQKFIRHLGMLLSTVLAVMKVATLRVQKDRLQRIMDSLQDEQYQYEPVGEFNPREIFLQGRRINLWCSRLLLALYLFVGTSAVVSSTISTTLHTTGNRFTTNNSCYDTLLYYFYIPFPSDTKKQCEGAIMFMGVSIVAVGWIIASHDTFYAALLICLKTQFVILGAAIKTIRQRVLIRLRLPKDLQIFNDEQLPILEEELYREIKRLTRHLIVLLDIGDELEEIFYLVTLGQVNISLLSFASVLFVATSVPLASPEFFTQLEYFTCLLTQLAVFCWFGDRVRAASQDILHVLYECDWLSASRRFKVALITTMCRMQRPIYLSFGKFGPLTINSLVSVCKCSFSYYTVFKTVGK